MRTVLEALDIGQLVLHVPPVINMTEDQFFEFCQVNRDLRFERTSSGDIVVMAPEGGGSGYRGLRLGRQLDIWAERDQTGVAFGSSAGFTLPNGAVRAPDASWVRKERLRSLSREQKEKFLPLCPDFVVEVRSPSDRLADLREKMSEYMENGAGLGWLLDSQTREAYIYRPGATVERLRNPANLAADPELPGFVLDLATIWELAF
jgi:Uma2 family endonuclease